MGYEIKKFQLINGKHAGLKSIVGYCSLYSHPGYISKVILKEHGCVEKQCPYLEKIKNEYWDDPNERKRIKQETEQKENDRILLIHRTLEASNHVYITSITEQKDLITITYIYDVMIDLYSEIHYLKEQLGKTILLKARKGSAEAIEILIRKRRRETIETTELTEIPGVGPVSKSLFNNAGIYCVEDLCGRNASTVYHLMINNSNRPVDMRFLRICHKAINYANVNDKNKVPNIL